MSLSWTGSELGPPALVTSRRKFWNTFSLACTSFVRYFPFRMLEELLLPIWPGGVEILDELHRRADGAVSQVEHLQMLIVIDVFLLDRFLEVILRFFELAVLTVQ